MRIKKVFQGSIPDNKILNAESESQTDTFSCEFINQKITNLINNKIYPIGSIYISVNEIDPSTFIGGTWEKIEDKFLLGSSANYELGSEGGEETHTLTIEEIPSHKHVERIGNTNYTDANGTGASGSGYGITSLSSSTSKQVETREVGSGNAHNNMPPYIAVSIWKRIS